MSKVRAHVLRQNVCTPIFLRQKNKIGFLRKKYWRKKIGLQNGLSPKNLFYVKTAFYAKNFFTPIFSNNFFVVENWRKNCSLARVTRPCKL